MPPPERPSPPVINQVLLLTNYQGILCQQLKWTTTGLKHTYSWVYFIDKLRLTKLAMQGGTVKEVVDMQAESESEQKSGNYGTWAKCPPLVCMNYILSELKYARTFAFCWWLLLHYNRRAQGPFY